MLPRPNSFHEGIHSKICDFFARALTVSNIYYTKFSWRYLIHRAAE